MRAFSLDQISKADLGRIGAELNRLYPLRGASYSRTVRTAEPVTKGEVRAIREAYEAGESLDTLVKEFSLSAETIKSVVRHAQP